MNTTSLIVVLSMMTMLGALVFALVGKARVEALRHDPDSPKSALSKDSKGPSAVENLDA